MSLRRSCRTSGLNWAHEPGCSRGHSDRLQSAIRGEWRICFGVSAAALVLLLGICSQIDAQVRETSDRQQLESALGFDANRDQTSLIAIAIAARDAGDLQGVVEALQDVLDGPSDTLVRIENRFVHAHGEANRLLAALPAEGRTLYERRSGDAANAMLKAAVDQRNLRVLEEVASRYRHTSAGRRALRLIAQQALDHGDFGAAAASFLRLFEGAPVPEDAARRDAPGIVMWVAALISGGRMQAAHGVSERYAAALTGRPESIELNRLLEAASLVGDETADVAEEPAMQLPSSEEIWSIATVYEEGAGGRAADELRRLRRGSVPMFLQPRPMVVDQSVVIRSAKRITRADCLTGTVLWTFELDDARDIAPRTPFSPPPERQRLMERALGDAIHSTCSVDQGQVYFLRPNRGNGGRGGNPSDPHALPANRLTAVALEDGNERWSVSEVDSVGGESDPDAPRTQPVYFRSAPAKWGSRLLVCGEHEGELSLFALKRETGEVEWSTRLCSTEGSMQRDDRRLGTAAPVLIADERAYCATGGGAIVAVDLQTRGVIWAARYPRESLPPPRSQHDSLRQQDRQLVWPVGWRETYVGKAGESIILASPESERLWVFDSGTGELRWSLPRGSGLYVAGVFEDRVVIVDWESVTGLDVKQGEIVWAARVGFTSGRGVAVEGQLLLPMGDGGYCAVDLSDGQVQKLHGNVDRPAVVRIGAVEQTGFASEPASLSWSRYGVVRQTPGSTVLLAELEAATRAAEGEFRESATDRTRAVSRLARLQRQRGQLDEAAGLLEQQLASPGLSEESIAVLRRDLLGVLRLMAVDEPGRAELAAERAAPHLKTVSQHAEWAWLLLSAKRNAPPAELVRIAFGVLDLEAENHHVLLREDHAVRLDRAIQAILLSRRREADDDGVRAFDAELAAAVEARLGTENDLVRARWADVLDQLPSGRKLRLSLPLGWSSVDHFVELQVRLLAQSGDADRSMAAASLLRLGSLYDAHSDPDDARGIYRRVRDDYSDVRLSDGTDVASVLAEYAARHPDQERYFDATSSPWPTVTPEISSRAWPEGELYFIPVRVTAKPGGLFDRLNVAVYRIGTRDQRGLAVRFSGAGFHRPWSVTLPPRASPLRSARSFPGLRRAWGFGPLLVLQVGADVYGIAPLDAAGEPRASIVWPPSGTEISTTEDPVTLIPRGQDEALQAQIAEFDESPDRVDSLGHLVGRVGPVLAGYFCIQQGGSILTYETATGEELWRRTGVLPGVRCVGDDEFIVLVDDVRGRVTVLDPVDGSIVDEAPYRLPAEAAQLATYGRRALLRTGDSVALLDLVTNLEEWRRSIPETTVCFPIDSDRIGLVTPGGGVEFVAVADGETTSTHQIDMPERMVRVRVLEDPRRFYLAVSGPRDDPELEQATPAAGIRSNEGHRRLIVNGWLSAFDRETEERLWSAPLENASLALDQDVDVPLLVLNELRKAPGGEGGALFQGRLRCLDRRSGALLFDEESQATHNYFLFERDIDAGWVELRLPRRIIRFDYAAPDKTESESE